MRHVTFVIGRLEVFMQSLRCLAIVALMLGIGLSLGCSNGEASIMRGMERGTGEAKESFIPLKGGKKKPEPRMDPAPRMAPGQ